MLRTFSHTVCLGHRVPYGFPERPERLTAILDALGAAGLAPAEEPAHPDVDAAIERVHGAGHPARLERAERRGDGLFDSGDNPLAPGTHAAARAAVDAVLRAADWAVAGSGRAAFAAVRPPGHHAENELAMGFCYFNNMAVAVEHLRAVHGLERVAIYDFDVHHGNGTQHLFERSADVLYVSTHQYPFYPGTGAAGERGEGAGEGTTVNVPLAAGCGDAEYARAIEARVLPALREFQPQVLLISAGFDAWRDDPVGGMRVSREAFAEWGRQLGALAAEVCEGRVVSMLEGGYDLLRLGDLTLAYLEGLAAELGRE